MCVCVCAHAHVRACVYLSITTVCTDASVNVIAEFCSGCDFV